MNASTMLRAVAAVALAWLAAVVMREDLAEKKIRNRHLTAGLAACAGIYLLQAAVSAAGSMGWVRSSLVWNFYWMSLRHLAASLAAGISLWLLDVWPAGDAKLFIVCAAALPLIHPGLRTFPNYLFLHLLANIFVLPAAFIVVRSLLAALHSFRKDSSGFAARTAAAGRSRIASSFRTAGRWREWLPAAATTGLLFFLQGILRRVVARQAGALVAQPAFLALIIMLAWERSSRWLRDPRFGGAAAALGAAALGAIAWSDPAAARGLLRTTAFQLSGFGLLFLTVRAALEGHLVSRSTTPVGLDDLRAGMVLSEESASLMRSDSAFFREHMAPLRRDGLTPEQVARAREWFMGLAPDKRLLSVTRGYAFAPWIFAGTLFTLAVSRDAASLLVKILR